MPLHLSEWQYRLMPPFLVSMLPLVDLTGLLVVLSPCEDEEEDEERDVPALLPAQALLSTHKGGIKTKSQVAHEAGSRYPHRRPIGTSRSGGIPAGVGVISSRPPIRLSTLRPDPPGRPVGRASNWPEALR